MPNTALTKIIRLTFFLHAYTTLGYLNACGRVDNL